MKGREPSALQSHEDDETLVDGAPMEVTFHYTDEEFDALRRSLPFWMRHLGLVAGLGLGAGPFLFLLGFVNWLAASTAAAMMLVFVFWYTRHIKRAWRRIAGTVGQLTLTITPEALACTSSSGWSSWRWSGVEAVTCTERHVIIQVVAESLQGLLEGVRSSHVVPRRSFPSQDSMERFAEAARDYRDSQSVAPGIGAILAAAPESEGGAVDVTYRNTEQCTRIVTQLKRSPQPCDAERADGGRPAATPPPRRINVLWFLAAMLVTAGVMLTIRNSRVRDGIVTGVFLGALVGCIVPLVEVLVISRALQRRTRRRLASTTFPRTTLRASPQGLLFIGDQSAHFSDWKNFRAVRRIAEGLVFEHEQGGILHFVPQWAFVDQQQAESFAAIASSYLDQAAECNPSGATAETLPTRPETGNPYQSPWAPT